MRIPFYSLLTRRRRNNYPVPEDRLKEGAGIETGVVVVPSLDNLHYVWADWPQPARCKLIAGGQEYRLARNRGISVPLGTSDELTFVLTGRDGREVARKRQVYDPATCSLKDA